MLFLLDEHSVKTRQQHGGCALDAYLLKKYRDEMAKAKRMILDRVKNHVICHIARKGTAKDMWDALSMLYQGSSE